MPRFASAYRRRCALAPARLTGLLTSDRYSAAAAPGDVAAPALRRSAAFRRSLLRRSSTLRFATRRSPAPRAGLTRLSARALRSAALLSPPARLPSDLLSSTVLLPLASTRITGVAGLLAGKSARARAESPVRGPPGDQGSVAGCWRAQTRRELCPLDQDPCG